MAGERGAADFRGAAEVTEGSDDRDQLSSSLACRVAARRPLRPRAARQQGASYGRIQELIAAAFPGLDAWTVDSSIAWWAPEDQNN